MRKNKFIVILLTLLIFLFGNESKSQGLENQKQADKISQKIIDITLYKKNDSYRIVKTRIFLGEYRYFSGFEQWKGDRYNGRIVSFKNETLGYFPVDNNLAVTLCSDGVDDAGNMFGGCKELPEGEILIQMPYLPNGECADIYDLYGKKVLTIDLTSKATCNENDQCDRPIEDGENCPQDCKNNEPVIDQAVVQLSAVNQQKEVQAEDEKVSLADLGWWGIAILIILLAGGGIGYWVYKRNKDY
jgi:hypothetical protein